MVDGTEVTQTHSAKLLGIIMDDDLKWNSYFWGKGRLLPALNKRLYAIRRLAIPRNMLKNVANSLWTSKLRYGLQLSARVILKEEETGDGNMKAVQIAQNKQLTKDMIKCKQYNFVTGSKGRNNVTS